MLKNKRCSCLFFFLALTSLGIFTQGCSSYQNIAYFKDLPDSSGVSVMNEAAYQEPRIQPDDILGISIQTIDPTTSMMLDESGSASLGSSTQGNVFAGQPTSGFLVDKKGEVELAMLGKVKILGLTTFEARELIREKMARFYKNPTVQVRFLNFKITVIGEVAKPATYTMPNEKVSVLDALGAAGDLTIYGRRENVLLVRNEGGKKHFVRFNLNSSELFNSEYFYLKQNDVVYVEPDKGKAATTDAARNRTLTVIASLLSVVIVAISRF